MKKVGRGGVDALWTAMAVSKRNDDLTIVTNINNGGGEVVGVDGMLNE